MKSSAVSPDKRVRALELRDEALASIERKDYPAARDVLMQSLQTQPTAEAYDSLGMVYGLTQRIDEAAVAFEKAIRLNPQYDKAYANLAELVLSQGHILHAVDYYILAMRANPRQRAYRIIFLNLAKNLHVKSFNNELKDVFTECFEIEGLSFDGLALVWADLLRLDPLWKPLFKAADKNYETFRKTLASAASRKALTDPYFILGLGRYIVPRLPFENLARCMRRFLLEDYRTDDRLLSPEQRIALATGLARHSLLTEYIADTTPEEAQIVAALKKKAETDAPAMADPELTTLLACYAPISELASAPRIAAALASASAEDPALANFVNDHIDDWLAQQEIRKSIPSITPINDATSQKVREQYEAFPYPRWNTVAGGLYDEELEARFRKGKPQILVAGSGTGQEAIEAALSFPNAEVLGVDLSLSSLAYSIKRAKDLGAKNIAFRQGDILGLGALDKKFDYIASSGVLHHMKDPAAGLKILVALLKPDGLLRLALYSRLAQRHLIDARGVIAEKKYAPTSEGIREFRRAAPDILNEGVFKDISSYRDYYTLSECRDLLFHVQERQYTVPQLKSFLGDEGLRFLRFYLQPMVVNRYKKLNPQDAETGNLDLWDKFEQDNPDTFKEMYRFWCVKA
jgi:SAM-dependent methyltransferase